MLGLSIITYCLGGSRLAVGHHLLELDVLRLASTKVNCDEPLLVQVQYSNSLAPTYTVQRAYLTQRSRSASDGNWRLFITKNSKPGGQPILTTKGQLPHVAPYSKGAWRAIIAAGRVLSERGGLEFPKVFNVGSFNDGWYVTFFHIPLAPDYASSFYVSKDCRTVKAMAAARGS